MGVGYVVRNSETGQYAGIPNGIWVTRKAAARVFGCLGSAETNADYLSLFFSQECKAVLV